MESHNFYVEHWYHTVFWNKVREFGELLARHGFLEDAEDIFYLQRRRGVAMRSSTCDWPGRRARSARGPGYWPPIVAERKRIYGGDARLVAAAGARQRCPRRSPSR